MPSYANTQNLAQSLEPPKPKLYLNLAIPKPETQTRNPNQGGSDIGVKDSILQLYRAM